jgi:hypothetical protein
MGKGSRPPTPPDPYDTAAAESQFNRLDTYSPSGSGERYGYTNAQGQFVQGVAPEGFQSAVQSVESTWERQIREALEPASLGLTNRVITDNIEGMPDAARARDTSQLATDIFNTGYARMAPQFERENERLLQNLQNRGIPVGSEAFGDAYGQQQQGVNDALRELTMNATQAAQGEQSRLFSLDSAARSNSIAELVAAMGGGYNPPNATPSGNAPGVNYGGMVESNYQNQMAQYNQQQQNRASTAGALGSLGGAMLMKCSREFKDIEGLADTGDVAAALMEMPVAVWRYRAGHAPEGLEGKPHLGPMAEDFHAATGMGDGNTIPVVDMVGLLMGALQNALMRIEVLERHAQGRRVN